MWSPGIAIGGFSVGFHPRRPSDAADLFASTRPGLPPYWQWPNQAARIAPFREELSLSERVQRTGRMISVRVWSS